MNAPATFQSLMNDIFCPYLRKFVLVFFDDILIYSKTKEQHREHLKTILRILAEQQFFANEKKCTFGKETVAYLGHEISSHGVAVDKDKIKAILEWEQPKNLRELRGFLGLTGYYRKYVERYAQIAGPLTDQLRKDSFGWTSEATGAFNKLKEALTSPPVLATPNFAKEFVLETDASGTGIGAVLLQDSRPLAYFSKLLGVRARQKSIYEKELMAICLAIQKWRYYLLGRHFVVRTDQQSLRFLMQQREVSLDYQKWVIKLLGYSFDIQYKPGRANQVADALSRKSVGEVELGMLVSWPEEHWELLFREIDEDPFLQQIKTDLQLSRDNHEGFELLEGRLLYRGCLVIPRTSTFKGVLLQQYHESPATGHARGSKNISSSSIRVALDENA